MGIVENDSCTFCHNNQANLKHIVLECTITKNFWRWIMVNRNTTVTLDEKCMFYNDFEQLAEGDFLVMLCAKFTILKCRNILARNRNTPMDPLASLKITFKCFLRITLENSYHKYTKLHGVHLYMTKHAGNGVLFTNEKFQVFSQ